LQFTHMVSKFDLTLLLRQVGQRITGGVGYATRLFERATIERYLGYYRRLLQGMVEEEREKIGRLPLLGEEEREQLLHGWNNTAVKYGEQCVHEMFEEQ